MANLHGCHGKSLTTFHASVPTRVVRPSGTGRRGGDRLGVAIACGTVLAVQLIIGCGSRGSAPAVDPGPPTIASKDELRQRLEYIATSGITGSGLAGMPEIIERLENAAVFEADYRRLEAAESPEAIKSIAQEMLKKL